MVRSDGFQRLDVPAPEDAPNHTAILHVSANGSGGSGEDWARAFTTLPAALAAASTNANELTLIKMAPGTYDVDVTADPTYAVNASIIGAGTGVTIISNGNGGATAVLKFSRVLKLHKLSVDCGTGEDGIIIDGTNANGSEIHNVDFDCESLAGAADAIQLSGGCSGITIEDVHIHGETTNTTGIRTLQCSDSKFEHVHVHSTLLGIHLDHADDDNNSFEHIHVSRSTLGIQIDAGATDNHLDGVHLIGNTNDVTDAGTTTRWENVELSREILKFLPATMTGTAVASKNVANTYADSATQIVAGATFTANKPMKVVGYNLLNPSDATATYIIKLLAASTEFYEGGAYEEGKWGGGDSIAIDSGWLAPQTQINGNCKTENAVGDTIEVFIAYKEMS